jgi:lysine decarboxylase
VSDGAYYAAPYFDAVVAYGFRGPTRFHVPGHKGGPGADPALQRALGDALQLDLCQDLEGIDMGPEPTPYHEAEELAAAAYGAQRTWFLTNGATQGNHALCLALAPLGAPVVAQRSSHASVIDGLVLSGGIPTWVAPEYDEELGMAHGITPAALAAALERTPGARAAFVVSPTYYGVAADVAGLVEVAHAAGVPLLVDQAWGSHFGFHPAVPPSAVHLGADAVLTSTHKIVGSLTQSAMLHIGPDARMDVEAIARAVRLVRSTSQSTLLLGSLDAARRQLAVHGQSLLERTLRAAEPVRAAVERAPGCALIGEELIGRPGVHAYDPMRIVIDVRGTGRTGYELAANLRSTSDLHVELAMQATLVLVLGLGQPQGDLDRFAHDLVATIEDLGGVGETPAITRSGAALVNDVVLAPREAFLGPADVVAVEQAVGRVSAESIAGYPPGIPALLPGERITGELVGYLREIRAAGARLHGASDPEFRTVCVVRDA